MEDDRPATRGPTIDEVPDVVAAATEGALDYLDALGDDPVRAKNADEAAEAFAAPLPEEGLGATETVRALIGGFDGTIRSAGPRFFHFVIGGTTPAALGADWLATAVDQNNGDWISSPLGAQLEVTGVAWLQEMFGLPRSWGGVLTTGATMANFTGLACARRWWAERHGVDLDDVGFADLPPVPVLSSGYIHPSATKALAMLGIGRSRVRTFARDAVGRLDRDALRSALDDLGGDPAIIVANAGEVNAGEFDPIDEMADLAEEYGCWLHVDGAFGLFAALSPRTRRLVSGIDRAHSVIADGHKWLNVPHDCGFAFVRDPALLTGPFAMTAAYLPKPDDPRPHFLNIGPEGSRRARSLSVWATLRAYGRRGYQTIVERHLDLAQRLAARVDDAPDLERLADVPLNIVCFRYRPPGVDDDARLDELNRGLGEAVLEDGRVFVGTTTYAGRVAFRPAIVNWRTSEADIDLLVDVIRELGEQAS